MKDKLESPKYIKDIVENPNLDPIQRQLELLRVEVLLAHGSRLEKASSSPYESTEVNELYMSLSKAQLEMESAKTDSINPFFKSKYADLASVIKASRIHLAKNGISVIQRVLTDSDERLHLFTRLCHSSGQWIESKMSLNPLKQDIQTLGSYMTYLRRYNYACMVGVVSADEDDDGEKAMGDNRKQIINGKRPSDKISSAQLEILSQELDGFEDILDSLLTGFNIGKLSDLLSKSYIHCVTRIRDIKKAKGE